MSSRVSLSRIVILLGAVFVGLYLIPRMFFGTPNSGSYQNKKLSQNLDKIKETISQSVEYRLCVYEGPFPFSSRQGRARPYGGKEYKCDRCEDLYAAGLLTKRVEEYTPEPMEPVGDHYYRQGSPGMVLNDVRYDLTDFGRSVYQEGGGATARMPDRPRFCFGKAKLHKIVNIQPPIMNGSDTLFGIQYIVEVPDPHPFVFDPGFQRLGLKAPKPGKPALYPTESTTAIFFVGGGFDLDSSISYGPLIK